MIKYKYNSKLLKLFPTWVLAVTIGNAIHVRRGSLSTRLKKHEECHVAQYAREGFFKFLVKYLYYSARFGYKQNPYEIEARAAEGK